MLWAVFCIVLWHSLLEFPLWHTAFLMPFVLVCALLEHRPGARQLPHLPLPSLLAGLLLLGVLWARSELALVPLAFGEHAPQQRAAQASRLLQTVFFRGEGASALARLLEPDPTAPPEQQQRVRDLLNEAEHYRVDDITLAQIITVACYQGRLEEAQRYVAILGQGSFAPSSLVLHMLERRAHDAHSTCLEANVAALRTRWQSVLDQAARQAAARDVMPLGADKAPGVTLSVTPGVSGASATR